MKKRKQKPLHQLARDMMLTPNDTRELMLFRDLLRAIKTEHSDIAYKRIYKQKD